MSTILGQAIPADVFKYKSIEDDDQRGRLADIVSADRLFFSVPDHFNDPFDTAPVLRPLTGRAFRDNIPRIVSRVFPELNRRQRLEKCSELARTPDEVLRQRSDEALAAMRETGIYSLSADPSNLLMWSHYACSHRGVCLHFDMRALHQHFTPNGGPLGLPVIYSRQRPTIAAGVEIDPIELMKKIFLVKADAWEYEQEWRFLHYRGGAKALPFPPEALQSIILGAAISEDNEKFVQSLIDKRKLPIRVRRAVLHDSAYEVGTFD